MGALPRKIVIVQETEPVLTFEPFVSGSFWLMLSVDIEIAGQGHLALSA